MPAIGQIETFIAQREIRYLLITHRQGQRKPIVKRRVLDLVPGKCALAVRDAGMHDFTAPPFHQGDGERFRLQGPHGNEDFPFGQGR